MSELLIKYFAFNLTLATILALLEIQIEGRHGWAQKLPTVRFRLKFVDKLPGLQGEFTGYHILFFMLLVTMVHLPFLFMKWDFHTEVILISCYCLIVNIEDFLWFVFNPYYGLKHFKKAKTMWHQDWIGPIPLRYIYGFLIWLILFIIGFRII